jgi:fatty-acyl-CoA synthase
MNTEKTFQNLLDYWAEKTPEKEAVYDGTRRISYFDLQKEIMQMAIALSNLNVQKGDRVITFIPNWHEYIILMFALAKLGAAIVPCNAAAVETEVKHIVQKIQPKVVFLYSPHQLTWVKDYDQSCTVITVRFEDKEYRSFDSLMQLGKDGQLDLVEIDPEQDILCIMQTSGTTGYPKGVEITQASILQLAVTIGNGMECTDQDITVNPLPNNHLFGMIIGLTVPLYFGGKTVLIQNFNAKQVLTLIEEEKASILHGVPSMFIKELHEYKYDHKDVTSLRTGIVAGAGCPANVVKEIVQPSIAIL